jgi:hypothetical protein
MSTATERFLRVFSDPAPALCIKFREEDAVSKTVQVQHRVGSVAGAAGQGFLDSLQAHPAMGALREFYQAHDGLELCRTFNALRRGDRPMLEFKPADGITAFTARYIPGGDLSWIMDLNKSRAIYRGADSWIAFAEVDTGPCCLTTFVDGPNAGCVYFAAPQPGFNILRPIARSFEALLERVAKDLPAFLRLVRATVCLRGDDGQNYGYKPFEYLPHVAEPS